MPSSKPCVTFNLVANVMKKVYGLHALEIRTLPSFDDCNVKVGCDNKMEYLLRIKLLPLNIDLEDLIASEIGHLHKAGFLVPCIVPTLDGKILGQYEAECEDGSVACFPVQLLVFIPGNTIFHSNCSADELYIVARNVGTLQGMMQKRLMSCKCKPVRRKEYLWYTENFPFIRKYLHYCKDEELYKIIGTFVTRFEEEVLPKLAQLRKGPIHGDVSDTNVIIVNRSLPTARYLAEDEILANMGIIDFNEAYYGCIVFDVTVCIAYMMTQAVSRQADPMKTASQILKGYLNVYPITDEEMEVVFWAIAARLSLSYVMYLEKVASISDSDMNYNNTAQAAQCPELLKMLFDQGKDKSMASMFQL